MKANTFSQNGYDGDGHYTLPIQQRRAGTAQARPALRSECVWMDGELVPFEDATVHVLNPTLHYGPGLFEEIRCYSTARGPAVFRLETHLQRFLRSGQALGVGDLRYGMIDLRRAVHVTVQVNNLTSCYVRPILYFAGAMDLEEDSHQPSVAVVAGEWTARDSRERRETGIRVMVSPLAHLHPGAEVRKSTPGGQYVNTILARSVARRAGFDEAVLLDSRGYVADCTAENLFVVHDDVIYTSPRPGGASENVARETAVILARDLGYTVAEEPLAREQLYGAHEAFVCGTASEVAPVCEIDFQTLGDGRPGPITRAVQALYADTVRGRGRRSRGWLEYVMMEPLF